MRKGNVLIAGLDKRLLDPSQYNDLGDCIFWFTGNVIYDLSVNNRPSYSKNFIHDQRKSCFHIPK